MNGGDKARILHIQEAIDFIIHYTNNKDKRCLTTEPLLRFAVERKLEIIGEASNHLSEELKQSFSNVEWRTIVAFRNFIAHEYFGIDLEILWNVITIKIPELKQSIEIIINNF